MRSSIIILLKLLRIGLLLLLVSLLSGCWDRLEIEERAIILGIAFDLTDKIENEGISSLDERFAPQTDKFIRITAQIAVPGRIPLGPVEGGGGGSSAQEPVWAVSATGRTVDGAIMALQQELADRIFFGHLRIIVISEEFARTGTANLNDFFKRNPQIRRLTWIAVSEGPAEDIMKAKPELERVPALYLLAMLDHAVDLGKYPNEFAGRFWSKLSSDGQEPNLPYIALRENNKIMVSGMAIFKGDRMVGLTKPIEIGFYMAITNTKQGGYAAYTTIPGINEIVMFHAASRISTTEMSIRNGKPHFDIDIHIEGDIREQVKDINLKLSQHVIEQIERQLSHDAAIAQEEFIKKTQTVGSDIFGFGEHVRAKEPDYWTKHIKTKEAWEAMYKDIEVNLNVHIRVRRVGMKEI